MKIVDQAKLFIIDLFEKNKDQKLTFHTLEHTLEVVRQSAFIGQQENLGEQELKAVLVAAWFHDTGYLFQLENHEAASIDLVRSFFKENEQPSDLINLVENCILITKRDRAPQNLAEKIILDADISHIANENFITISKKLRKERSNCLQRNIPQLEYWQETLDFLKKSQFYTDFAKRTYQPAKDVNMEKVKKLVAELDQKSQPKKTAKEPSTTRGVESMFRLTASNQMRLSAMADKKANILISINSILISVSAAAASSQPFSPIKQLLPAVIILFLSSLMSLIFAILSCRPKISAQRCSESDIKERETNLLFFGNFHKIPYPLYDKSVKEMMGSYDYLYTNLIKDQYHLGLSLTRKYKLLRIAYDIFMSGFIIAALVFIASYLLIN